MRQNLVIEGPDGAGKTTLIRQLRNRFPQLPEPTRAATSEGGPLPNMTRWIAEDAAAHLVRGVRRLYDRHPLISGPIYEPICPQSFPTRGPWYGQHFDHLVGSSYIVICLPALRTVRANLLVEPQLPGVVEHIDGIYFWYRMFLNFGLHAYDYEEDDFSDLADAIEKAVFL